MPKPAMPPVPTSFTPSPVPPALKAARKSRPPHAALLVTCAAISACHAGVRPDGIPADCPPRPSGPSKQLGVPAGYEFEVHFLMRDKKMIDRGFGPPRVGAEELGDSPRLLLPTNRPVEMRFYGPVKQTEKLRAFDQPRLLFPEGSHLLALAKQGPERVEITFTRLVLKDGSEWPICAVGYDNPSSEEGKRGLPTPLPPPVPPPDHLYIDTGYFIVHVLEPF